MRPLFCLLGASLISTGCMTTKPARELKPAKIEEFSLPPGSPDSTIDPPAYPQEKTQIPTPSQQKVPKSMQDAGGGPGGGGGSGGMMRGGGGGGGGPGGGN